MDFDQQELLRLNTGLDPRDVPKTWWGAGDLDEQELALRQKRLAKAAAAMPASPLKTDRPITQTQLARELSAFAEAVGEEMSAALDEYNKSVQLALDKRTARIETLEAERVKFCGVFKPGEAYSKGSLVTHQGSVWYAHAPTVAVPGTSKDWQLACKRGRDGKDGKVARKNALA